MKIRDRIFAALYDRLGARWEERYGAEVRGGLLAGAHGRVLEVGVGTGLSFPYYPAVEELVGVDASEPMLKRARQRAADVGRDVTLVRADAENLPFEDGSFDTVVLMAVLCSVDNPADAVSEFRRVLRPDGRLLFNEHVRSSNPGLARWQDRLERPWGVVAGGCHPNRRTLQLLEAGGFRIDELEQGELPDVPRLVRPYVRGTALLSGAPRVNSGEG
jgi:ubiquinone/menaquinone biosynthesis C-methylase UbiE